MSDHEGEAGHNEMAAEDSVNVEEKKPKQEDIEETKEEENSKETEPEKEEEIKMEEEEVEVEIKKKKKAPKEKKQKQKEETPAEETPAEETPAEETPAEKTPAEKTPAEETPATPKKEPDVPLYDQPLEMSGKRDRKKVERFVQEAKKEELNITGSGTPLGDIPFVEAMITKTQLDDLKVLHRVAYNRPGSGNEIKKNLRKFNGFSYTKDDKKYQSKVITVERILMSELKRMLMILGLERQGNKAELVERLMNFMMHPEDMGKKPPSSDKKSGKSRGRPSKKSLEKKQNNTSQDDTGSSRSDSDQSGSEADEGDEEEEGEEEEKPKKTPGRKPAAGKKTPAKRTPAAKKTPASKRAKPAADGDDSDSDDEPLAKKVKQPPTDAELKVMVKKILEGANLEEVTMKSVCRQVYDSYPDFDLTHKKVFIKETVKSIIS